MSAPSPSKAASSQVETIDRALAIGSALVGILVLAQLASGVLSSVKEWYWNDARLARGIALWYGYHLYPGRDSREPIIGTMHGPVPHLLYSCLAFLKDPTLLLTAACTLSCLLYFGAVLWLQLKAGGKLAGAYGFVACSALLLASPGARYAAFTVHVDALAMCFAMLAAGLLMGDGPLPPRTLIASAVLAMLSVASKQTMAPVAIALPCFVLMVEGTRAFGRYIAVQLAASAAIFAAMLAMFRPPRDLLFNTFTLVLGQPRTQSIDSRTMEGLLRVRIEVAAAAGPLLLLIAVCALTPGNIREKIGKHRWLVFLWMAVLQLPIELRAWTTHGGIENHLGVVTLFVALAATLGLAERWRRDANADRVWIGLAARVLLIGMLLSRVPLSVGIFHDARGVRTNSTQVAYDYQRRHPGRAYFPYNPLATLLAEGKLTDFDHALFNRELAGFPMSQERFTAGIPAGCELVAYPPRQVPRAALFRELLKDKPLVDDPELQRWRVYRIKQPAAVTRLTSTRSTSTQSTFTQSTSGSRP